VSRPAPSPPVVAAVAVGGAVGALARWAVSEAFPTRADAFPWATFAVNVVGCGLLAAVALAPFVRRRPVVVALLGPGVLGGFTTLSTYSEETRVLLAGGDPGTAAAYVLGTLVACLAVVVAVNRLGRAANPTEGGDR
jgi:fluoride exporter